MEQQIISTMMNEEIAHSIRANCAKSLLRSENGYIRSVAYWYTRRGYMSAATKMWWVKLTS